MRDVRCMNSKIADILIGIVLLISSLESLLQYSSLSFLSIVFALIFFVSGFAVIRAYSWSKYVLYVNSAICFFILVVGLYITNFEAWHIGITTFLLAVTFAAYGYFRYRRLSIHKSFKKEILIFAVSLVAFSAFFLAIDDSLISAGDVEMGVYKLEQ